MIFAHRVIIVVSTDFLMLVDNVILDFIVAMDHNCQIQAQLHHLADLVRLAITVQREPLTHLDAKLALLIIRLGKAIVSYAAVATTVQRIQQVVSTNVLLVITVR